MRPVDANHRLEASGGDSHGALRGSRILFIFYSLELGGAERQGLLLAEHMQRDLGARVLVAGLRGGTAAVRICERLHIPWTVLPFRWPEGPWRGTASAIRWAWQVRQIRPEVLLPYTMDANLLCGLCWRWIGARTVIWNQRDEGRWRRAAWLERRAVRSTPWFVSNSWHGAHFLQDALGAPPERVRVVPNGTRVQTPLWTRAQWRARLEARDSDLLACMVGNLHDFKDHSTLLRAWPEVCAALKLDGRRALLLLAGRPGNTWSVVERLVSELDLSQHVRLLGEVEDISGLLSAVDLGVFSSRTEGLPNGVLECMAQGLAVVATDIPGVREALGSSGVDFLAAPGDSADLARRVVRLARDPNLRAEVGGQNRRRIETEYSVARMCDSTVRVLSDALMFPSRDRSKSS